MNSEVAKTVKELRAIHEGNAWHGPSLRESLAGVTHEQAAARPVPGAHSVWEIVLHIAAWEGFFRQLLEGRPVDEPEEGDFPPPGEPSAEAWARALAHLDDTHERLLKAVASLDDSALGENLPGRDYSARYLLRGVVRHHVYHAGQVALLRKAFTPAPAAA